LYLGAEKLEALNLRLQKTLAEIRQNEIRYETLLTEDADYLIVAFGTVGRIAKSAVRQARAAGLKVGLFRPITLWPFPEQELAALAEQMKGILVTEMNAGQMLEDVRRITHERVPIHFVGRMGGAIPLPDDILPALHTLVETTNQRPAPAAVSA